MIQMQGGNSKMTLVDIKQTNSVRASIEDKKRRMDNLCREVRDINRQLMWLSGMSEVCRSLDHIIDDMETEQRVLRDMHLCLTHSLNAYVRHEENITDFAEEKARNESELGNLVHFDILEKFPHFYDLYY